MTERNWVESFSDFSLIKHLRLVGVSHDEAITAEALARILTKLVNLEEKPRPTYIPVEPRAWGTADLQ